MSLRFDISKFTPTFLFRWIFLESSPGYKAYLDISRYADTVDIPGPLIPLDKVQQSFPVFRAVDMVSRLPGEYVDIVAVVLEIVCKSTMMLDESFLVGQPLFSNSL